MNIARHLPRDRRPPIRCGVTQQVHSQFVNFEVAGQVLLGLPVTSKLI